MTFTVLGVSGSPRDGGNTRIIVEEALKAIAQRATTDLVQCGEDADVHAIVEKMDAADAVVIGTPSHFGMPPAPLKAVMDASWEHARREAWAGKPGIALAVESHDGGELAAVNVGHYFTAHRMVFLGFVVGRGLKEREVLYDIKAIREGRELANRVVDYLEATRSAPPKE